MSTQEMAEWMRPIVQYLEHGTLPEDKLKARKLKIKATHYSMYNIELYRRSLSYRWSKCVSPKEDNYVLKEIHEGICGAQEAQKSSFKKLCYKVITGPTCQRMPSNSFKSALSVSSLLVSRRSLPTFSIQLEVHGLLLHGEWTSWDHCWSPHPRRSS